MDVMPQFLTFTTHNTAVRALVRQVRLMMNPRLSVDEGFEPVVFNGARTDAFVIVNVAVWVMVKM